MGKIQPWTYCSVCNRVISPDLIDDKGRCPDHDDEPEKVEPKKVEDVESD